MNPVWQTKLLSEVSSISYGHTESASEQPIGPRFLRITDIQNDHVDWDSVPYCKIDPADLPKYRLERGDIVFARTGATTGKSYLINGVPKAVFASYLIRLRLRDRTIDPKFVSYFFQTDTYWDAIKAGSTGSAQGGFNATKLGALSLPVPSLAEQQRIVAILDKAFVAIATAKANTEKNLLNARALFESQLQAVFRESPDGWQQKTLGEVCSFIGGSQPPKSSFSKTNGPDKIRLIQIRDYKSEDHVVFIRRSEARRLCRSDDVMIGRYGPPLFQILRGLDGAYNVALMKAAPDETKLSKEFLFYFLRNQDILQHVIKHSNRAAGQTGLTKETLEPYPISIPSLATQADVATRLWKVEINVRQLESLYGRKLLTFEKLKKALLHEAFSGTL